MDDTSCNCSDDDEDTDFIPEDTTNSVGHRNTSQESAMMAFDTLGLKRKDQDEKE